MQKGADTQRRPEVSAMHSLRRALVASVGVPATLFVGAVWLDHDHLLADAADDGRRAVSVLREHALKAIETHELLNAPARSPHRGHELGRDPRTGRRAVRGYAEHAGRPAAGVSPGSVGR